MHDIQSMITNLNELAKSGGKELFVPQTSALVECVRVMLQATGMMGAGQGNAHMILKTHQVGFCKGKAVA